MDQNAVAYYENTVTGDVVRASTPACGGYFLDQDNSGRWYVVSATKRVEWMAWLFLPENDERARMVPEFARLLGGHHSDVVFPSYKIDGG